jgi:hypothetical protein
MNKQSRSYKKQTRGMIKQSSGMINELCGMRRRSRTCTKRPARVDADAGQVLALLDSTSERMNQLYAHVGEGADDTRLTVARAMRDTWLDVERSVRQCLESIRERVVRGA